MDIKNTTDKLEDVAKRISKEIEELAAWAEEATDKQSIPPQDIARGLFFIKDAHKALDGVAKQLYHVKDKLEKHTLPTRLESMDLDQIRIPDIARSFSVQDKMSASFLDKEKGFEWLRETGQGDLIQETVNAGTLTSFVRNMIVDEGLEPPDDIVKVSTYKTISISKYTPKPGAK